MGVTITCKKTGSSIDLPYGGFAVLRETVAALHSEEFGAFYRTLREPPREQEQRLEFFTDFTEKVHEMLRSRKIPAAIANLCMQSDCDGYLTPRDCKVILKTLSKGSDLEKMKIGYQRRADCATMGDFRKLLEGAVETKSRIVWH